MWSLGISSIFIIAWVIVQATLSSSSVPKSRYSVNRVDGKPTGTCPEQCKCKPRAVYCDRIMMEAIPKRLPRNLATLRLKDNRIRSLQYDSFRRMFDLRHLIVTGNKISYIEPTAFKDLYSLISLSLSQNELAWISEDTFKHQLLLKELTLSRNRLKSVELVLSYLESVQVLNLAENQLDKVTERTFQGNVAVRILDLHKNRIHHIHRRAFRNLKALTFLILRDNPLTEVYVHFHTNYFLEQLDITRCQLTSVMKDTPPGLRDLRLSENNIENVESDDFQHPSSIQLLVLSHNVIVALSDEALEQMTALYDLHLTKNRLSQLPNSLPPSLHGFYASFNHITEIGDKTFSKQQHLNSIVLSHNHISEIDQRALRNLKRLVSLDLSYNQIRVLRTSVFKRLYSLQRLDLSNNPLFQIEPGSFIGMENLHILKMSSVEGSELMRSSALADLPNLLFLDLSNSSRIVNSLLKSDEYSIQSIDTVEDLNVMNSGLRGLPASLRLNLPFLKMVKLTGNPWHCDTSIAWVGQWMRSGNVEFHEPDHMVCSSPPRLKGRRLSELTWNDLVKVTGPPKKVVAIFTRAPRVTRPKLTTTRRIITTPLTTTTMSTLKSSTTTKPTTTTSTTTEPTTTTTSTTTEPTTTTTSTTEPTTTTTSTSTTSTELPSTTPSRSVFLQFKRVRPGENKSSSNINQFGSNIQIGPRLPPPPLPPPPPHRPQDQYPHLSGPRETSESSFGAVPADHFTLRVPRYSLFRLYDDPEYLNDGESSSSDDYEDFVLPISHQYDPEKNKEGAINMKKQDSDDETSGKERPTEAKRIEEEEEEDKEEKEEGDINMTQQENDDETSGKEAPHEVERKAEEEEMEVEEVERGENEEKGESSIYNQEFIRVSQTTLVKERVHRNNGIR